MSFANPVFGIDTAGAFSGMGDALSSNPFGGSPLSVGGFGGSSPSYGGFGGMGQAAGVLGLANLGIGMMGMNNTRQSFNQMQQLGGLMRDIDFGTNLFAQNKDIFEQKDAPRWAAKFSVNDPGYRQAQALQAIKNPGIAGRYAAFTA
jgi:hypothetical protein